MGGVTELTIVVGFLEVHVDNATGEDGRHLVRVQRSSLLPDATGGTVGHVATILSQEDGDRVALEILNVLGVARLLHVTLTAPRVDVVTPKIDSFRLVSAVEVRRDKVADLGIVIGGISHTQVAVGELLGNVSLGVTNSSLDEGRGLRVGVVVGDFVAGKEANDVAVLAELIDDIRVALEQVHGPLGIIANDGEHRLAQIADDVDTCVIQQLHALRVILGGVNGVGTNRVGAQRLEKRNIAPARRGVGERVNIFGLSAGRGASGAEFLLVSNALHEELRAILVKELGTL